jgi:TolB-like protein
VLRPDPETDFLAHALPEAITTTLAGVGSLIVRSSASASRMTELDPKKLAEDADVDVALIGTLLRAGEQIRVTSQLVELPSGTIVWSQVSQAAMADVFELQDKLTQRIVESLELPLTDREARFVRRDVPATPRAHEFYQRATQQGETPEAWAVARDLYLQALDEDPRYAPAWARLARIYLLLGKYTGDPGRNYDLAESAARHAIELNPDLPVAHHAFAHIVASKGRPREGMLALLDRVGRGSNDPAVFAGLVTLFRFCGLLEASAAAHEQARQLDPHASTSAALTYWMLGRHEEALANVDRDRDMGDEAFILVSMGRIDEAIKVYDDRRQRMGARTDVARFFNAFQATLERRADIALPILKSFQNFPDPEGLYYMARAAAYLGATEDALASIDRAEQGGFFCYPFFARDPWLDSLRTDPRFLEILRRAESRMREAQRDFESHPASRVLTVG